MGGFDTLALGSKILFGDNWFSDFNAALHESSIYNVAQTTIASVAVFTGGMNSGFNKAANSAGVKPSCFVAGTLVMAVAGMVAIETIKSGDKVISTDPETMETGEKTVLETYIREVTTLVHITVNGEEIITTVDHPFYVQGRGFVEAGKLLVGDKFLNVNGNILLVENFNVELTDEPVTVYNFQVEDFHTYHVCTLGVLVHNASKDYSGKKAETVTKNQENGKKFEKEQFSNLKEAHPEAETQVSVKPMDSNGNAMRNGGNYLDGIALDSDGNPFIEEYKASQTATYTSNQKANGFDTGALNKDLVVTGEGGGVF